MTVQSGMATAFEWHNRSERAFPFSNQGKQASTYCHQRKEQTV
jgi:hypothetical protein